MVKSFKVELHPQ